MIAVNWHGRWLLDRGIIAEGRGRRVFFVHGHCCRRVLSEKVAVT